MEEKVALSLKKLFEQGEKALSKGRDVWHGKPVRVGSKPDPAMVGVSNPIFARQGGVKDKAQKAFESSEKATDFINRGVGVASGLATAGLVGKGLYNLARGGSRIPQHAGVLGKVQNAGRVLQRGARPGGVKLKAGKYLEENPLTASILGTSGLGIGGSLALDVNKKRTG